MIKEVIKTSKMNLKEFSEYFNIPYRTVQKWNLGSRIPPEYVVELIRYKLEKENK